MRIMYSIYGHVVCVKTFTKSKIPKVVVTYWKTDEAEEDGENVTMTIYGLFSRLHCWGS